MAGALAVSACGGGGTSTTTSSSSSTTAFTCQPGTLTASGSTALQPLAQKAAQEYQVKCPGSTVTVSGGGSSTGLSNVASGVSDIGDSDVPASAAPGIDASTLKDHQVAIVVFAVVVNPKTNVSNLTTKQVQDIFSGTVTNWKDVGGGDLPVTLIERKPGSGTRRSFDKDVMKGVAESATPASTQDSSQLVLSSVQGADGGVSYLSAASATSAVVKVSLGGVAPTGDNVKSGTYPFYSHEHMYTKGDGSALAQSFLAFVMSDSFQAEVSGIGFLPSTTTSRQSAVDV